MHSTQQFLTDYPDITMVEALITDCNGIARGKWLPVQKLDSIEKQGLKLPKSALGSYRRVLVWRWSRYDPHFH